MADEYAEDHAFEVGSIKEPIEEEDEPELNCPYQMRYGALTSIRLTMMTLSSLDRP